MVLATFTQRLTIPILTPKGSLAFCLSVLRRRN